MSSRWLNYAIETCLLHQIGSSSSRNGVKLNNVKETTTVPMCMSCKFIHVNVYIYIYIDIHRYIYVYIYIYISGQIIIFHQPGFP